MNINVDMVESSLYSASNVYSIALSLNRSVIFPCSYPMSNRNEKREKKTSTKINKRKCEASCLTLAFALISIVFFAPTHSKLVQEASKDGGKQF